MKCSNNLKQLGLAMHNYEGANGEFPQGRNAYPQVVSAPARLLAFVEQDNLQKLVNYDGPLADPQNVIASKTRVGLFVCPSDPRNGQVPGMTDFGTNYVACNGTGVTLDAGGNITGYLKIPDGNGIFAQNPVRIADITDGTSNTAAFSESTLGNGAGAGEPPRPPTRGSWSWGGRRQRPDAGGLRRGGRHVRRQPRRDVDQRALRQHALQPLLPAEPPGKWDCGNASHNKGLTAARSYHAGGRERAVVRRVGAVRPQLGPAGDVAGTGHARTAAKCLATFERPSGPGSNQPDRQQADPWACIVPAYTPERISHVAV